MDLENWKRVFDLVHSNESKVDKNAVLLSIMEDALLDAEREEEQESLAALFMHLLKQPTVEWPDPTDRMYYATLVARNTSLDSPNLVDALGIVIEEARKGNVSSSDDNLLTKFKNLAGAVEVVLKSDFRKKHHNFQKELFGLYLREAIKIASFDTVAPIRDLTTLLATLPADTKNGIKDSISDTIVDITKNAAKGAASLRQSLPRAQPAGKEAQAQA